MTRLARSKAEMRALVLHARATSHGFASRAGVLTLVKTRASSTRIVARAQRDRSRCATRRYRDAGTCKPSRRNAPRDRRARRQRLDAGPCRPQRGRGTTDFVAGFAPLEGKPIDECRVDERSVARDREDHGVRHLGAGRSTMPGKRAPQLARSSTTIGAPISTSISDGQRRLCTIEGLALRADVAIDAHDHRRARRRPRVELSRQSRRLAAGQDR